MGPVRTIGLKEVPALRVGQWLDKWDTVDFSTKHHRRRPDQHFYMFTMPASHLKALSGIYRRTTAGGLPRHADLGIQRRHEENRSHEIHDFIIFGFPWSQLGEAKRASGRFEDLRKPGWLPTAIVVNILKPGDKRQGAEVSAEDLVSLAISPNSNPVVKLPRNFTGKNWRPKSLHPIEVIDGQHRLWAFEGSDIADGFELPVVA